MSSFSTRLLANEKLDNLCGTHARCPAKLVKVRKLASRHGAGFNVYQ
jgi:hypothetical protein